MAGGEGRMYIYGHSQMHHWVSRRALVRLAILVLVTW